MAIFSSARRLWVLALAVVATAALLGTWSGHRARAAGVPPPLTVAGYELRMDAGPTVFLRECVGVGSTSTVTSLRDGTTNQTSLVLGSNRYLDMICRRGLTADLSLQAWRDQTLAGATGFRRDAVLVAIGSNGTPVAKWTLTRAFPRGLEDTLGAPTASGAAVTEILTLAMDAQTRVAP